MDSEKLGASRRAAQAGVDAHLSRRRLLRAGITVPVIAWSAPVITVLDVRPAAAVSPPPTPPSVVDPAQSERPPSGPTPRGQDAQAPSAPGPSSSGTDTARVLANGGEQSAREANGLAYTGIGAGAAVVGGIAAIVGGAGAVRAARRSEATSRPDTTEQREVPEERS